MVAMPEVIVHREDPSLSSAVVFVHGYGGKPDKTWGSFPTLLAKSPEFADRNVYSLGYTTRMAPEIRGGWKDQPRISNSAELMGTVLRFDARLSHLKNADSIAIIAHSMGGLVSQRALADSAKEGDDLVDRISHLIMFGTPSGGLERARRFHWFNRQIGDMASDSEFITALRTDWAQLFDQLPFTLMAGAGDEDAFVPAESSLDPFRLGNRFVVPGDHLSIVKPESANDLSFRVVAMTLTGDDDTEAELNEARVAVELKQFAEALAVFERAGHLDDRDAVLHAIALEGLGRLDDALALLRSRASTDARGTLAGRLKRRWWSDDAAADAKQALQLYRSGFDESVASPVNHSQAYYHAINASYLELALNGDEKAAADMARHAIEHAEYEGQSYWAEATIAEAHLQLGDPAAALEWYGRAAAGNPPIRRLEQTAVQAERVASLRYDDDVIAELRRVMPLGDDDT